MVFHDINDIKVGINWRKRITQVLRKADVVLAIMGPGWSATKDAKGLRRLDNARDPVRNELELAIQLEIPVIPVLVGAAKMPSLDEFPDSLKPLYDLNAAPLRDSDFDNDFERLFQAVQEYGRESESPSLTKVAQPDRADGPAIVSNRVDSSQMIKLVIWSLAGVGLAFFAWLSYVILILFVGVILIVLGVTDGKIGFIPNVAKGAQKWLRSWGIVLTLISIVLYFLSNAAGRIFSPVSEGGAPQPAERHASIQLIPARAHLAQVSVAANESKPVATLTVVERRPTQAPKSFGTNVIVYVDTINLFGKSRFLICQTDVVLENAEMDYDAFKTALARGQTKIFSDTKVSKNEVIDFRWNERDYRAKVELKWFVKGKGYADIEVYSR